MTKIEYSYCPIRYMHDPTSGERLNVGVVLYAPSTGQVLLRYDRTYSRLSDAFASFEGDEYRVLMQMLEFGIQSLSARQENSLFVAESSQHMPNAATVVRQFWPDQGLSYQVGEPQIGFTEDLTKEAELVYDRFVRSQYEREGQHVHRTDEDVWQDFRQKLESTGVTSALRPVTLGEYEEKFARAFKNEKWHALEPVTLDYADWTRMKNHINTVVGKAWHVRDLPEFGVMYILLGKPTREKMLAQYSKARAMLASLPVPSQLFEESDAEALAKELLQHLD